MTKATAAFAQDARLARALHEIQEMEGSGISRAEAIRQYAARDETPDTE